MYPRTFLPSTLVTVSDGVGHTVASCRAQLFKPLLGCSFNGQQPLIVNHKIPNQAGIILRGLVEIVVGGPLVIHPGPAYWKDGTPPSMILSEDPNALSWVWMDALPWLLPSGSRLWKIGRAHV